MTKILLLHHDADNDGLFSASIYYDYLIKNGISSNDIVRDATNYSKLSSVTQDKLIEWREKYTDVVMLDISFNKGEQMKQLYHLFEDHFVWCDHHKPIIEESKSLGFDKVRGIRNTNQATILNVWQYLYDPLLEDINDLESDVPMLFRILDAYDNWYYQDLTLYDDKGNLLKPQDYTYINTGVNYTFNLNFNSIYNYVSTLVSAYARRGKYYLYDDVNEYLRIGKICLNYDKVSFSNCLEKYGDTSFTIDGRSAIFIISSRPSSSLLFESMSNIFKHGIVAKYCSNGYWEVSVYNTKKEYDKEIHLGEYLKSKYGKGGGHAGAAGITFTNDEFMKILNKKVM